ncbi:GlxA family transcriptional regulator [Phenylobacterium sp.]|uniref:GlxA family transcriptional regulator n=1 Tax=Phenylobacterium sp. TaxID=1871053 RepID=UPI0012000B66|nr:GlxA family transcriptional regulator [Phenylobacterium sp.]THD60325.1 MAG: GlxA family transcriptional regulator [Phenylobacterium sp.]
MLVAILVPPVRPHLVEIAAIADAFSEANAQTGQDHYRVRLISEHREPIRTSSGLTIVADATLDEFSEQIDTLIVPPTHGVPLPPSPTVTEWLRTQAPRTRRYGSACTGAFILGAAGLLNGRRVTTHWQYARDLAAQYPDAMVEPDRIFVRDGPMFTSAGVTAAFDLMLSLIEEDLGRDAALAVARFMVMYLKRPGGQSQFSAQLAAQFVAREPIQRVQQWIREHLRQDLSVAQLAHEVGMSQRNFARAFVQESHVTPAHFVELTRIDEARRLLEETKLPVQRVALDSGFSGTQAMRKAFCRRLEVTPSEYRERFRTTGDNG